MTSLHPQSSPRKIIAVDMDEVIADALGEHLQRYNRDFPNDFKTTITPAHLLGRSIWDYVPTHRQKALEQYMLSEDFFSVLDVMPESQRVLDRLQLRYDIFIASAAMEVPTSFNAKFNWLARHFPFIPTSHIVFCGDKSILRADFLIDDNPRQLRLFHSNILGDSPREGILFSSPANAFVTGFRRVDNWRDVEKMFLG
jgi:5'(3')-deoxyribonucleotidase